LANKMGSQESDSRRFLSTTSLCWSPRSISWDKSSYHYQTLGRIWGYDCET
jgi:hypothetical protein